MPFGLWKSKWEIHREEMARRDAAFREEMTRRDAEFRQVMISRDAALGEDMARRDAALREDMARRDAAFREEMASRDGASREEIAGRDAEFRAERAKADAKVGEEHAKAEADRVQADAEWRKRYAELLDRIDKNQRETMAALNIAIDELRAIRRDLNDLTDAVKANTEAVLKLIDRFDEWEGRPPGSGRVGPRSV